MEQKRYFWLKLQHDFFASKRIKKLRTMAGGDTFVIIYLKMQLLSIKTNGVLTFTGLDKDFASELAIDLDESAENVAITLAYLKATGLIETSDEVNFLLPYARENTSGETAVAGRVRAFREREREKALQCNADVTPMKQICNGEIEKEKELEIDSPPIIPPTGGNADETDHFFARFNAFWTAYPKKVGKKDALKAWKKIRPSDELFGKIMDALNAIKDSAQWRRDGGQFIPYPATWLNGGRWEDDPKAANMVKPKYPQNDHIPSTFDVDDAMEVALRRSYGDQYEKFYPNGVGGLNGETKTGEK